MQSYYNTAEHTASACQLSLEPQWVLLDSTRIEHELDVFDARRGSLQLAQSAGFRRDQAYNLVTAMTELGNNIVFHSRGGYLFLHARYAYDPQTQLKQLVALMVTAEDIGPGIKNISEAMQEGYSTGNSMGCGLSGVKRLMDSFTLESAPSGTRAEAVLWINSEWSELYA